MSSTSKPASKNTWSPQQAPGISLLPFTTTPPTPSYHLNSCCIWSLSPGNALGLLWLEPSCSSGPFTDCAASGSVCKENLSFSPAQPVSSPTSPHRHTASRSWDSGTVAQKRNNNSNTSSLAEGEMFLTFKIKNRTLVQISASALPSYMILRK